MGLIYWAAWIYLVYIILFTVFQSIIVLNLHRIWLFGLCIFIAFILIMIVVIFYIVSIFIKRRDYDTEEEVKPRVFEQIDLRKMSSCLEERMNDQ